MENFDTWKRFLQLASEVASERASPETVDLANVIRSSLRRFFRMSEKNKLIFVEALFWRTKQDNVLISRFYGRLSSSTNGKRKDDAVAAANGGEEAFRDNEDELAELDARVEDDEEEEAMSDGDSEYDGENNMESKGDNDEDAAKKALKKKKKAPEPQTKKITPSSLAKPQDPPKRPAGAETSTKKTKTKKAKKSDKTKGKSRTDFVLDEQALSRAIRSALQAGATPEAMMSLVQAFEAAEGLDINVAFVPAGLEDADKSFELPEMRRVMLCLGMRPPNRSLATKSRLKFSCEVYWRILDSEREKLSRRAEAIRQAIVESASAGDGDDAWTASEVAWCVSDDENDVPGGRGDDNDEGEEDSDDGDSGEEEQSEAEEEGDLAATIANGVGSKRVTAKPRLRRVVSSDEDDSEDDDGVVARTKPSVQSEPVANVKREVAPDISSQKKRRVISDDDDE